MADKHSDLILNRIKLLQKRSVESNEKILELQQKTEKYCEIKRQQIENKMEKQLEKQRKQEELRQKQIENYLKYKEHKSEMDERRDRLAKLKQKQTTLAKEDMRTKLESIRGDAGSIIMENRSKSLTLKEQKLKGKKQIESFWSNRLAQYSEEANRRRRNITLNLKHKQRQINNLQTKEEDLISQFTMLQDKQRAVEDEYEQLQQLDDELFMREYLERSNNNSMVRSANAGRKKWGNNNSKIGKYSIPFKMASKPKYQEHVLKDRSLLREQQQQQVQQQQVQEAQGEEIFLTGQQNMEGTNWVQGKNKVQIYKEQQGLPNLLKKNEGVMTRKDLQGFDNYANYQSKIGEFE